MATPATDGDYRRQLVAPAAFEAASGPGASLRPLGFEALVNLRGPADDTGFAAAVGRATGIVPPLEPNRRRADGDRAVIWLGPDEWLIAAPDGEARAIEDSIREALGDTPRLSVVDVSCNYTGFELSGPSARDVLAKGCALDLDQSVFGAGHVAQTELAKARVLLAAVDDGGTIEIRVRNSFARYLFAWLDDAMAEYRV